MRKPMPLTVCCLLLATAALATSPALGATRIEGVINAIDYQTLQLVVGEVDVQATPDTLIQKQGVAIEFADLELGQTVAVCGIYEGQVLVANRITVKYSGTPGISTRIEGPIQDIFPADLQLLVNDITVQVTPETIIQKYGLPIAFEELEVGQTVAVCGVIEDDVLYANKVTVKWACLPLTRIEGTIVTIDPEFYLLVVGETVVQVTPETIIKMRGRTITFEDLKVDQAVAVCGVIEDDILYASRVTVRPCLTAARFIGSATR